MNKIAITILLLSILACTKRKREIIANKDLFLNKQILVGDPINIKVGPIKSIGIAGGYMVIVNNKSNLRFNIVDLDDMKKVKEILIDSTKFLKNPFYFNSYWIDKKGNVDFEIVDFTLNQFTVFSMSDFVNKDTVTPKIIRNIPFRLIKKYTQIYTVDSKTLLATSTSSDLSEGKVFLYKNIELKWLPFTPKMLDSDGGDQLRYIYYSFISYNRKHSEFALAMKYFPVVEFYKDNGEHIKDIQITALPDDFKPGFLERPTAKQYYNSTFAGDKYFYALCLDAAQGNYGKNIGNMELHVFDWGGNLISISKLDRMFLGNFIVDEKHENLIIQSFVKTDKQHPLVQYSLKNTFKALK
jgi:hypothetical protein